MSSSHHREIRTWIRHGFAEILGSLQLSMHADEGSEITRLLERSREGDTHAAERLLPLVYDELRRMAQSYLVSERKGHTLDATALVHEAYMKLVAQHDHNWRHRGDFFGVAAKAMRRILVDHARTKKAKKRGGSQRQVPLDDEIAWFETRDIELANLDEALDRLASIDREAVHLIELRFFAGLSVAQVAKLRGQAVRSTERDWTHAKAWLRTELERMRG